MFAIRPELPEDHDAVRRVHELAFAPSTEEAELVDALRASGDHVPELCLVALFGDEVIGHVCFSRARVDGVEVLALAPMAVLPEWQRRGAGTALVREALRRAAATDLPLVVVVGHPAYYPRFGFEPAGGLGLRAPFDVPADAWMAHRLPAYRSEIRGLVTYAAAFR